MAHWPPEEKVEKLGQESKDEDDDSAYYFDCKETA